MRRRAVVAAAGISVLCATVSPVDAASPVDAVSTVAIQAAPTFAVTVMTDGADAAPGDGMCASATGGCTLRAAVTEAAIVGTPAEVTIPAGSYPLTEGPIPSTGGVTITGAGRNKTTIDIGGGARGIDVTSGSLTLAEVTVTGGLGGADGAAALRATEADLTLRSVTITENRSDGDGGAIVVSSGTLVIDDAEVTSNFGQNGGAVLAVDSAVEISGSSFRENGAAQGGGALFVSHPRGLTIDASTFTGNSATGNGGAVHLNGYGGPAGSFAIVGTTFEENLSTNDGGALYVGSTSNGVGSVPLELNEVAFRGNQAAVGGAIAIETGTVVVTASTFTGNRGGGGSGGAIAAAGELTVRDTVFDANESETSGGAIATTAAITIDGGSFTDNAAGSGEDDVFADQLERVEPAARRSDESSDRSVVPIAAAVAVLAASIALLVVARRGRRRVS